MTQELIVVEHEFMPALSVPQAIIRFNTLVEFVQNVMRDGVDYGKIPGTDKPTLLKAGAEKLTTLFGLTVRFAIVEQVQDWTGDAHGGQPFFYYWYRCQLWRGDLLIAEADGSCNSRESKYRYRYADRACPKCGTAAIKRSKFPPKHDRNAEPGWYCYSKAGGCGAEFGASDPAITAQQAGRIPNPDICDQVNTIQKMAQKRALVAASLIGCNASEFFTQDVEDIAMAGDGATYTPPVQPPPTPPVNITTGEVIDSPAGAPDSATPVCDVCGTPGKPSRYGSGYYCPNKAAHGGKFYTIPEREDAPLFPDEQAPDWQDEYDAIDGK